MNILITGGAGFIGSHIAAFHLKKGDTVHCVDNLSTGNLKNITELSAYQQFKFTQNDILNWPELTTIVHWADRIYHMAAIVGLFRVLAEPIKVLNTNIIGTEKILEAVSSSPKKPKVLIASSSSVYGGNTNIPHKETDALTVKSNGDGLWSYSVSKLVDELYAYGFAKKKNIPIYIARFFNTIGPHQTGQYGMVVPRLIEQAIQGKPFTIFGDGTHTRSFCDVRDTVTMLDLLMKNEAGVGQVVNIGNDYEISINELALLIKKITGSNSTLTYIPYKEAYGLNFDEITRRKPCLKKLRSLIEYKHHWTLADTIADLAKNCTLIPG